MSDETKAVLNLDELFGQAQPIKVKWQGKDYELRNPEAMGPVEYAQFSKLQTRVNALQVGAGEMDEEQAGNMEQLVINMLAMLNSDLGKVPMPFVARMRALEFYSQQLGFEDASSAEKKAGEAEPQAGTTSTPDSASGTA